MPRLPCQSRPLTHRLNHIVSLWPRSTKNTAKRAELCVAYRRPRARTDSADIEAEIVAITADLQPPSGRRTAGFPSKFWRVTCDCVICDQSQPQRRTRLPTSTGWLLATDTCLAPPSLKRACDDHRLCCPSPPNDCCSPSASAKRNYENAQGASSGNRTRLYGRWRQRAHAQRSLTPLDLNRST